MIYLIAFTAAIIISAVLTPVVKRKAIKWGAVDMPDERKVHSKPIPRLGGVAIFIAFTAVLLVLLPFSRHFAGLLGGAIILLVVGIIDDLRGLKAWQKLIWQIVAAMVALAGGIGIVSITNPFGGTLSLEWGRFSVDFIGLHFHIIPIANLLSILWIVGVINAINFLDGLDGLAAGVSTITATIIFLLAIAPKLNQPDVALIAITLAGATLGFLPFNFYPAKIFMGDSGAYFLGLVLALLAIYSGGKIATATLVLGFTIIDGLWTVIRRLRAKVSVFKPDRRHLHHLLLDAGMSHRSAVLSLYALSLLFGVMALFAGSFAKLIIFSMLLVVMFSLIWLLLFMSLRRAKKS